MFAVEPRYLTRSQVVLLREEREECKRDTAILATITAISVGAFQFYVDATMGEKSLSDYAFDLKTGFIELSIIVGALTICTYVHFYLLYNLNKKLGSH